MNREVHKELIVCGIDRRLDYLKVVHVGLDPRTGEPAIWIEVAPGYPNVLRHTFRIFPTGISIPDGWEHVGSMIQGPYVWHVYKH